MLCWKGKVEHSNAAIVSVLTATAWRRGRVSVHSFLNFTLDGDDQSSSRLCRCTPRKRAPNIHRTAGWVGPTAGLHVLEKKNFSPLLGIEPRFFGLPARSLFPKLTPVSTLRTVILRS